MSEKGKLYKDSTDFWFAVNEKMHNKNIIVIIVYQGPFG